MALPKAGGKMAVEIEAPADSDAHRSGAVDDSIEVKRNQFK